MQLKLTMHNQQQKIDVQVDATQRIKTTLRVISENIAGWQSFEHIDEVRLQENGRRIKIESTYEEARIFSGAELII